MIDNIVIKNFKAAHDLDLRIAPLTVLAGLNGSGKSSVLQALGAVKQTCVSGDGSQFRLRGGLVQLGTFLDVHTEGALEDFFSIEVNEGANTYRWEVFASASSSETSYRKVGDGLPTFLAEGGFQMMPADRMVPRNSYPRSEFGSDLGRLGPRGEYAVEYVMSDERDDVPAALHFPREGLGLSDDLLSKVGPTASLKDQVSGWLQQLSPGVRIRVDELQGTDEVALSYGYVGRTGVGESDRRIRPSNVGFGLTYSLPIIVACLSAPRSSLLLLENPEAHLHPQGQSALGGLLAKVASNGVQVIVETHSDHVLNGIRLAAKSGEVAYDSVAIHYLTRAVETGYAEVQSPALLSDGRLATWPRGFFDQWDMAVDALLE
jgi:predicted ATPase